MSSPKAFASTGDLAEKTISFTEIGPDLYAYTAEGDPTGVIVGDVAAPSSTRRRRRNGRSVIERSDRHR